MSRVPHTWLVRLACSAALVVAAWAASAWPQAFELDRDALMHGEIWRLWTGHLVHGNATHFAYDVGTAVLLGCAFGFSRQLLWLAPSIAIALFAAFPEVEVYYGLSACLHAWVVALAAEQMLAQRGVGRVLATALLVGTLGKAALEAALGSSIFTTDLDFGGPVLHASHLVGASLGLLPLVIRARVRQARASTHCAAT